jgi:hypothetical protein
MMSAGEPPTGLAALLVAHPNHVPAVIRGTCLLRDENQLLVPKSATVQSLLSLLRKKQFLIEDSHAARFVIVDSLLPSNSTTFGKLYDESNDDILNVTICEESTYGSHGEEMLEYLQCREK